MKKISIIFIVLIFINLFFINKSYASMNSTDYYFEPANKPATFIYYIVWGDITSTNLDNRMITYIWSDKEILSHDVHGYGIEFLKDTSTIEKRDCYKDTYDYGWTNPYKHTTNWYYGGSAPYQILYSNYDVKDINGNIIHAKDAEVNYIKILSPANDAYKDISPDIQIESDIEGQSFDIVLYGKDKDGNWVMNMSYILDLTNGPIGFYLPGRNVPYVNGDNKITVENNGVPPDDPTFGKIMAEVQFKIIQTEANMINIIGFDDGKTYNYAPTWYVKRTGTYSNAIHQIYVNGVKSRHDCEIGKQITYFDYGYDVANQRYDNPYKIGLNIIEIKDLTENVVYTKKFVLMEWTDPNETNTWGTDTPTIPSDFLKRKFPFCIPFDLYNSVLALKTTPKAPVFEIDLTNSVFIGGRKITLDFSQFELWAKIIRWGTLILFTFFLILSSRRLVGD